MSLKSSNSESSGRKSCPLYGCNRVYTETDALEKHVQDHEIPAQSIPGKDLLCSTIGCNGSFPDMGKLMEHMRHHHKPNVFFLCESCRAKLRSYRGLLTHLHTCSKVARSKQKPVDHMPVQHPRASNPEAQPGISYAARENLSSEHVTAQGAAVGHMQVTSNIQNINYPLDSPSQLDKSTPLLNPPCLSSQEPFPLHNSPQEN